MIQVYTGEGKGKTTAALGLALRATGARLRVYIAQFIKSRSYSELKALRRMKNIKVEQFGRGCFIKTPGQTDKDLARRGLEKIKTVIQENSYDIIILDEINVALHLGLVASGEVLELVKLCPADAEIILTGRDAPDEIIACADLVSEIKEVKHYFKKGVKARRGIEF
jgi:cob(I)alamin adenosyltransferase